MQSLRIQRSGTRNRNEASMIWIEGLTQKKLVVATPMYAGNCTGFYMQGMMGLASLCTSYGVNLKTIILGDSLVTRGRNRCVDIFKATCSDPDDKLMFIDADIQFNASVLLKLIMLYKTFSASPSP